MQPISTPTAASTVFSSKSSYVAYRQAWKRFARSHQTIPVALYVAHALLCGRPLRRAFSPNLRQQPVCPYRALAQGLSLWSQHSGAAWGAHPPQVRAPMQEEDLQTLGQAWALVRELVAAQGLARPDKLRAIAQGTDALVQPARG